MKKPLMTLAFITCLLLGGLLCARGQIQPQSSGTNNASAQRQHETHSRLFRGQTVETIPDMLSKTSGDLHIRYDQPTGFPMAPLNPPAYPPYPLVAFSCTSDVIIVAKAQTSASHLTADERFVYTDWHFTVEQVLKDNSRSPITSGAELIVTRPGGTMEISGRKVYATDLGFKDFKSGGRYLLFLEFISQTGAYRASEEKSFSLEAKTVTVLARDNPYAGFEPKDAEVLLRDTNAAIVAHTPGCSGREKQWKA